MSTIDKFIARLLDTTGAYRETSRNAPALAFIKRGAGLGTKAWEKLPIALEMTAKQAALLLNTRADPSGYNTILNVADILLPAAVRQLYYTQRDENRKDEMRVRVQGYSLNPITNKEEIEQNINADAWAEQTTTQAMTWVSRPVA
jgi:hypothetical protein